MMHLKVESTLMAASNIDRFKKFANSEKTKLFLAVMLNLNFMMIRCLDGYAKNVVYFSWVLAAVGVVVLAKNFFCLFFVKPPSIYRRYVAFCWRGKRHKKRKL